MGRIVAPAINERIMTTFRQWAPKHILKNGSFDDSFEKQEKILRLNDGSFIDFLSYETDLDKFGSVQRHFVGYDEPPPQDIRDEGLYRLVRFNGPEMFAMTPLKTNTGWIRREIWRKREDSDITVCKWSIHDNEALSKEAVAAAVAKTKNDLWRRAREFGDFVDVGGLMYPNFEDAVLTEVQDDDGEPIPLSPDPTVCYRAFKDRVKDLDVVVGIDPGHRNAAFVWVGFDRDGDALVFDEVLLQQSYPKDYAEAMRTTNAKWGLRERDLVYVIDPAFRIKGIANSENVESALNREGIYCVPGENPLEAGCMQVGQRISEGMLHVSPACVGLRDEADEYAMEDREDGVFKEVRNDNSHRLDALRYACMYRTWEPEMAQQAERKLGWTPGTAPPMEWFNGQGEYAPMGPMS